MARLRRDAWKVVALACACVLFAACGSSDDGKPSSADATKASAPTKESSKAKEAEEPTLEATPLDLSDGAREWVDEVASTVCPALYEEPDDDWTSTHPVVAAMSDAPNVPDGLDDGEHELLSSLEELLGADAVDEVGPSFVLAQLAYYGAPCDDSVSASSDLDTPEATSTFVDYLSVFGEMVDEDARGPEGLDDLAVELLEADGFDGFVFGRLAELAPAVASEAESWPADDEKDVIDDPVLEAAHLTSIATGDDFYGVDEPELELLREALEPVLATRDARDAVDAFAGRAADQLELGEARYVDEDGVIASASSLDDVPDDATVLSASFSPPGTFDAEDREYVIVVSDSGKSATEQTIGERPGYLITVDDAVPGHWERLMQKLDSSSCTQQLVRVLSPGVVAWVNTCLDTEGQNALLDELANQPWAIDS